MEIRILENITDEVREAYARAFVSLDGCLHTLPFRGSDPVINCGRAWSEVCSERIFTELIRLAGDSGGVAKFYAISTSSPEKVFEVAGVPDGRIFQGLFDTLGEYYDLHLFVTDGGWKVCCETLSTHVIYSDTEERVREIETRIRSDAEVLRDIESSIEDNAFSEPYWRKHSEVIIRK